ncbi:MAG TPA: hypothetical protein VIY47_16395, partial [Ignavibacteriaceae bacterium]
MLQNLFQKALRNENSDYIGYANAFSKEPFRGMLKNALMNQFSKSDFQRDDSLYFTTFFTMIQRNGGVPKDFQDTFNSFTEHLPKLLNSKNLSTDWFRAILKMGMSLFPNDFPSKFDRSILENLNTEGIGNFFLALGYLKDQPQRSENYINVFQDQFMENGLLKKELPIHFSRNCVSHVNNGLWDLHAVLNKSATWDPMYLAISAEAVLSAPNAFIKGKSSGTFDTGLATLNFKVVVDWLDIIDKNFPHFEEKFSFNKDNAVQNIQKMFVLVDE